MKRALRSTTVRAERRHLASPWSDLLPLDLEREIFRTLVHLPKQREHTVPNILASVGLVSKHFRQELIGVLRQELDLLMKRANATYAAHCKYARLAKSPLELHHCVNTIFTFLDTTNVSASVYRSLRLLEPSELAYDMSELASLSSAAVEGLLFLQLAADTSFGLCVAFLHPCTTARYSLWKVLSMKCTFSSSNIPRTLRHLHKYYLADISKNIGDLMPFVIGSNDTERFYRLYPTFAIYEEKFKARPLQQDDAPSAPAQFKWRDVFVAPGTVANQTQYYDALQRQFPFPTHMALIQELLDMLDPFKKHERLLDAIQGQVHALQWAILHNWTREDNPMQLKDIPEFQPIVQQIMALEDEARLVYKYNVFKNRKDMFCVLK